MKVNEIDSPNELNRNVQFRIRDFISGIISLNLASFMLLFFRTFPSRMCFSRLSLAPGNELGKPDIMIASNQNSKPKTRNPNHHAPIQR